MFFLVNKDQFFILEFGLLTFWGKGTEFFEAVEAGKFSEKEYQAAFENDFIPWTSEIFN